MDWLSLGELLFLEDTIFRGRKQFSFLSSLTTLGIIYSRSGEKDKAREILDEVLELEKQRYVAPSYIAGIYGYLDDMDQAFEWLEKAYEERDQQMAWLKVMPIFNPLRSDQRFKAMQKKMNLLNVSRIAYSVTACKRNDVCIIFIFIKLCVIYK